MNKLLLSQIRDYLGDPASIPVELRPLLEVINKTYDQYVQELPAPVVADFSVNGRYAPNKRAVIPDENSKEAENVCTEDLLRRLEQETERRKKAEQLRYDLDVHQRTTQRIAGFGSWELDLSDVEHHNANLLHWSEETYRIFGLEPYTVKATNSLFFDSVHPEDREIIIQAVTQAIEKGTCYSIEHRIMLPNGREKIVQERAEVVYDLNTGKPHKMIGTVQDITSRKRDELKLKNANEELRTLTENMQEVFFSVDVENQELTYISAACETVYGYAPEEFYANNFLWLEVVLEEDKSIIYGNYAVLESGQQLKQEYRIRKKDGNIAWLECKMEPMLQDGKLVRLIGITADITVKKQTEHALVMSEYKFRSLTEHSSDAIIVADENLKITYASNSLYWITGFKPEEVIGMTTLSLAHPSEQGMVEAFLKEVLNSPDEPKRLLYRTRRTDGSYFWCERIATNFLHDPAIHGIVSNFRDVSERIESEQALRKSEHKFRSMIEHSADVIVIVDREFIASYCSDSVFRIAGFMPEEIVGQKCVDFVYHEDLEAYHTWFEEVLNRPGEPCRTFYRVRRKNGELFWTERIAVNLLDDPDVEGIVVNFRDVDERIRYEQALRSSNEKLQKINAELDKFVYSVSHDLRAPLASVLGIIDLTEAETSDPVVLEHLSLMKESILKLDVFLKDILDYSRNARMEVEAAKIDFRQLLEEIIDNLKYTSDGRKVALNTHIEGEVEFFSDKGRISIILNNLISNAIRYHNPEVENPFVSVDVRLTGKGALITVRDNGIGIRTENHQRVFDMFFREARAGTGSGLGLYIVKETVEKLKAKLSLRSEPGRGSEFQLLIPNNKRK